eukprot:TRINITY_DN5162_c0_g1_i4.p2 TRINITY_DN5162_c0_g1~~TRINITY_DN5162_c0_g1_i4.p2  ORF type:complete len:218 (+),score=52.08 TRINITY_DN5162_c0_g1_i4:63-716(+)
MVQLRSGAAAERAADYAFSAASDLRVRSLAGDLRLRLPRQEAEGLTVAALRRQLALATAEDVESLRLVAAGRMLEEAAALETFWPSGAPAGGDAVEVQFIVQPAGPRHLERQRPGPIEEVRGRSQDEHSAAASLASQSRQNYGPVEHRQRPLSHRADFGVEAALSATAWRPAGCCSSQALRLELESSAAAAARAWQEDGWPGMIAEERSEARSELCH